MTGSTLRSGLRDRMRAAMRERDRDGVAALRSVLAGLDNAEAVPVQRPGQHAGSEHVAGAAVGGSTEAPRRELSDAEEVDLVRAHVEEMQAAAREYDALGAAERAAVLRRTAGIVGRVLAEAGPTR